jgi:hypothetical protein
VFRCHRGHAPARAHTTEAAWASATTPFALPTPTEPTPLKSRGRSAEVPLRIDMCPTANPPAESVLALTIRRPRPPTWERRGCSTVVHKLAPCLISPWPTAAARSRRMPLCHRLNRPGSDGDSTSVALTAQSWCPLGIAEMPVRREERVPGVACDVIRSDCSRLERQSSRLRRRDRFGACSFPTFSERREQRPDRSLYEAERAGLWRQARTSEETGLRLLSVRGVPSA